MCGAPRSKHVGSSNALFPFPPSLCRDGYGSYEPAMQTCPVFQVRRSGRRQNRGRILHARRRHKLLLRQLLVRSLSSLFLAGALCRGQALLPAVPKAHDPRARHREPRIHRRVRVWTAAGNRRGSFPPVAATAVERSPPPSPPRPPQLVSRHCQRILLTFSSPRPPTAALPRRTTRCTTLDRQWLSSCSTCARSAR